MRVKNLGYTIIAMFVCQLLHGQQLIPNIYSAGNIGTGYATGGFTDYRSMGFNPTAIANIKTIQGGVTADRRFVTATRDLESRHNPMVLICTANR